MIARQPIPAVAMVDTRPAPVASTGPATPDSGSDEPPASLDESMEEAFLAEARERGEIVPPARTVEAEEVETVPLPALEELVKRIPADVRSNLEDLFRARFVAVKRVPKKALNR